MYPCRLKHGDVNNNVFYLREETDLERERIGERVRLRGIGDLLGGLRARLGELQRKLVLRGKIRKSVNSETDVQGFKVMLYYECTWFK